MKLDLQPDFLWGAATAAYQIEGAPFADGKGPSIWDVFCRIPGRTAAGDTGETACEHYYRWREDIAWMKRLNLRAYRLSLSWARILPQGRGVVNTAGLDFYDRLIDELRAADIEPLVTVYHWDLPAALQFELGGWASDDLPSIFADYAQIAFDRLGDRVQWWMTLNEPWVVVDAGYFHGVHPPGIRDRAQGYRAAHNLLRAHAYAVERYRASRSGGGRITFALNSSFSFPATRDPADAAAAERAVTNFAGWFGDPAYFGDYPAVMRERLGDLLPAFTLQDTKLLRGSMDYVALNYYTSEVVRHAAGAGPMEYEIVPQPHVAHTLMNWPVRPDGFYRLMRWLNQRYAGLPFVITENGAALDDRADATGFVNDTARIAYLRDHICAAMAARDEGVELRGFMVWSLLDNLEWAAGFAKRFGLIRCDHATQQRTMKASGHWYARLIASNGTALDETSNAEARATPVSA